METLLHMFLIFSIVSFPFIWIGYRILKYDATCYELKDREQEILDIIEQESTRYAEEEFNRIFRDPKPTQK